MAQFSDGGWFNRAADEGGNDWGKFSEDGWMARPELRIGGGSPSGQSHLSSEGWMPGRSVGVIGGYGENDDGSLGRDVYGLKIDPYGYRTNKEQIPELADFFNAFNQKHINQYGQPYNRPWGKNGETGLRDQITGEYQKALSEYNQLHGTNLSPNAEALKAFGVSPTEYATQDFSRLQTTGGFAKNSAFPKVLGAAASIFGGPALAGLLGGGTMGAAGAGALIGGGTAGLTGDNILKGAALGGLGGVAGSFLPGSSGVADAGSGWTSGFDLPMGGTAGLGQAASNVPSSFWNMMAGNATGVGDLTGGGMGMDFGDFDFGSFGEAAGGGDWGVGDWGDPLGGGGGGGTDYSSMFGPQGQTGAFPTIQGSIDQFSQLQPNWGGPGMPDLSNFPDAFQKALSASSFAPTQGGGAFMDQLQKWLSDPKNLMKGGSAIVNMLNQNRTAGQLGGIADRAAFLNQSLNQPQRGPYQGQLAQQMNDPASFFATNPVVKAQLDMAKNQMEANTAKHGAGGKVFGDYLQHQHNIMSENYYKNADLLSRLGGFTDGAGGAGSAFAGPATAGANAGANAISGFAQFFNPTQTDPRIAIWQKKLDEAVDKLFL